jgi:formylglycine-generating enzyme required for sulfatase activity
MGAADPIHPSDQTLRAYSVGKLYGNLADSVHSHLSACDECRERVAEMSADTFLLRLRDAQPPPDSPASVAAPIPGTSMTEGTDASIKPPPSGSIPAGLAEHPDYEILGELGRGGMGVVYLAWNKLMGRKEVLKVVSRELIDRRGVLERFLREIRNAAQLHHPNIVTAYSAIRAGESIVFAMEYVDGYDLAQLVKGQGPLPVAPACNFVYQAAQGLEYAHQKGMVHRDIKPSNLILAREGTKPIVKVLDFGLAKATREGPVEGGLTHEGQMLGTPDYIAPEQSLDAAKADIRADIYGLGCTLYYLLSGGPPFGGASLYEVLQAHHSIEAKALNFVRPEVPWELAAVVAKMMAKEPGRRYETPAQVAQALKPFFKAGESGPAGSKAEVSLAGPPVEVGRALRPRSPEATNVAPASPSSHVKRPLESTQPEPNWQSLIAVEENGTSSATAKPVARWWDRPRPPWLRPVLAAGTLLIGLSITWLAGGKREPVKQSKLVVEAKKPAEDRPSPTSTQRPGPVPQDRPARWTSPSTKIALVRIEGGEFVMGSPAADRDARDDERPQHGVRISPFYLGVTEVTQEEFQAVMGINPSWFSPSGGGRDSLAGRPTGQLPVEQVSWFEAVRFCNTLSKKDGLDEYYDIVGDNVRIRDLRGSGYRLPTEAEWEYACRAGKATRYCFGDDPAKLGDFAWYSGNSSSRTHLVRQRAPNDFGPYDMHGNVWEWCWDNYDGNFYPRSPAADPQGPPLASHRVIRGGSWYDDPSYCRSADRLKFGPATRYGNVGFRLALGQSGR